MFQKNQKLKVNMTIAALEYEQYKGSTVYKTLMKGAETFRFTVVDDNGSTYTLSRNDNPTQTMAVAHSEAHKNFVIDTD